MKRYTKGQLRKIQAAQKRIKASHQRPAVEWERLAKAIEWHRRIKL